nr:hypothetical protein CJLB15_00033 [Campylobacter phage CJLB-15]
MLDLDQPIHNASYINFLPKYRFYTSSDQLANSPIDDISRAS